MTGGKEVDGADRRPPHGSDVRESRRLCQSAQSRREYAFRQIRQPGLGRVGRARVRRPVGEATGSDKFSGRIGQVLKWRKWTSFENGPVLSDRARPGGRRWAAVGVKKKNKGGGRAEIKKKNFRIKNSIFEYTKALEICTRRFRRNFDMSIFPKFF
jgi:hypothetical protein